MTVRRLLRFFAALVFPALPCWTAAAENGRPDDAAWNGKEPDKRESVLTARAPKTFDTSFLPETLLRYDGKPLSREQGLAILKRTGFEAKPNTDRAEFSDRLRRAIDDELCRALLRAELKKKNIAPSREMVLAYLKRTAKDMPESLAHLATRPERYEELALSGDYQLTVALMEYFDRYEPDKLKITDAEIEDFYRAAQPNFLTRGSLDIAFIGVAAKDFAARKMLETAEVRLRQGEAFEQIAAEYNAKLPADFYDAGALPAALVTAASALSPGKTGSIVELPNGLAIVRLKNRGNDRYIPLADASGLIRMTLRARMAGNELKKMLLATMKQHKLEFYF